MAITSMKTVGTESWPLLASFVVILELEHLIFILGNRHHRVSQSLLCSHIE